MRGSPSRRCSAPGAANVGGVMDAVGVTPFEQAVALRLRLASSGSAAPRTTSAARRGRPRPSTSESSAAIASRPPDSSTRASRRGQDWELNRRLRTMGETIWFNPALKVTYRPRSTLRQLARQFLSTGLWRGELARRHPDPEQHPLLRAARHGALGRRRLLLGACRESRRPSRGTRPGCCSGCSRRCSTSASSCSRR